MTNFWQTLPRPMLALSPMDGVTDQPYRHIHKKYGLPTLIYTEFTSAEGLCLSKGRLLRDLLYDESQRPIIAQIFGKRPDFFRQAAIIVCELGFDGFDINMGCPAKTVAHGGSGAGLIRTPRLAQEIVWATKQGVAEWQNGATVYDCADLPRRVADMIVARKALLPQRYQQRRPIPVSVKTRVGYETPITEEWLPYLLETEPAAIGLHGRTLEQGYSGLANWDEIGKAAEMAHRSGIPLLGNGDILTLAQAHERVRDYGVDGVLVGRATYGNPFFFHPERTPGPAEIELPRDEVATLAAIMVEHSELYEQTYHHYEKYFFSPMRKHLSWYAKRMHGGKKLRVPLMQSNSAAEVTQILQEQGYLCEESTRVSVPAITAPEQQPVHERIVGAESTVSPRWVAQPA